LCKEKNLIRLVTKGLCFMAFSFLMGVSQLAQAAPIRVEIDTDQMPLLLHIEGVENPNLSGSSTLSVQQEGVSLTDNRLVISEGADQPIRLQWVNPNESPKGHLQLACDYCRIKLRNLPISVQLAGKMLWVTANRVSRLGLVADHVTITEASEIGVLQVDAGTLQIHHAVVVADKLFVKARAICQFHNSRIELSQEGRIQCKEHFYKGTPILSPRLLLKGKHATLLFDQLRLEVLQLKFEKVFAHLGSNIHVKSWGGSIYEAQLHTTEDIPTLREALGTPSSGFVVYEGLSESSPDTSQFQMPGVSSLLFADDMGPVMPETFKKKLNIIKGFLAKLPVQENP